MKKFLSICVCLVMTLSIFSINSYSEGFRMEAFEKLMDEVSRLEKEDVESYAELFKLYAADGDAGIEELKKTFELTLEFKPSLKKKLEEANKDVEDIKEEMDRLKKWTKKDLIKISEYVKLSDTKGLKSHILKTEQKIYEIEKKEVVILDIENHWANENIEFMAKRDVLKLDENQRFYPDEKITRAEFAVMISKALEFEFSEIESYPSFEDVFYNKWYYDGVSLAAANKIISGRGNGKFDPDSLITRQEMAIMIVNALNSRNVKNLEGKGKQLVEYSDGETISAWAEDSCSKASKMGIITGRNTGEFDPFGNATKAEAITIIKRIYDVVNN